LVSASALVSNAGSISADASDDADPLKRRQSLPAAPAGLPQDHHHQHVSDRHREHGPLGGLLARMHGSRGNRSVDEQMHAGNTGNGKRRSSLAVLRRDSCKIS